MSKRGRTLNSQARELVVKLHEYFERESQNGGLLLPVTQVRDRVGEALGIGSRTVGKILSEKYGPSGSDSNVLHTPKKRKRNKPVTGIDEFDSHAIRNHIYGYFTRGEFPTLAKLCATLKDAGLYKGSIESLRTVITGIGFRYKKVDKRKIVMERHDIIMQRLTFLREVKQIINWDNVIFLDETWLNSNHSVPKTWTDDSEASCSKVPIGKGGRLIICHAGSASTGFVENSLLAFQSKSTKEYHEEMDAVRFREWFLNLLQNIPPNSTIIMDNAPYHSVQIDKAPTSANKKADLVAWLQRKGVDADMSLLKAELLQLVKLHKPPKPTYVIDQLAEEHGHKVIRLPPYHCQYNAIELIWAQVKVKAQEDGEPFLKIIANPTIVYNAGETKAIFCNSSNEPIEWYSPENKKVERRSSKNTRVYVDKLAPLYGVPLIIHHIKISDSGNWTCKAGDLSDTIDMIVGEKVNIKDRNVNMDGDEGKSVKIPCEAKGHPTPVVVWYKENTPIVNDRKKYVINDDNSLEIKKLDHMDIGTYVCKVRQKALSHYTDKTVHLSVQHKPVMYNIHTQAFYYNKYKTEEVYAIINETKNITCSALANPQPTYRWYRREGYEDHEITDEDMIVHSDDGSSSVLMLRMEDETVLGQYKCTSKNSKGTESIVFHVSLGTKPDPPDFVGVVAANATDIVFNVTCSTCPKMSEDDISPDPRNLTVIGYAFELVKHKDHFEPDWDIALHVEQKIENETYTLFTVGGLDNTTTYHVRVASINAAGYSEWYVVPELAVTTKLAFRHAATTLLVIAGLMCTLLH